MVWSPMTQKGQLHEQPGERSTAPEHSQQPPTINCSVFASARKPPTAAWRCGKTSMVTEH